MLHALSLALAACLGANPPSASDVATDCVRGYSTLVASEYGETLTAAELLRAAIAAFCADPSEAGLTRTRESWLAARDVYGRTEVFRFGNGPIDSRRGGVETLINAWPVDERSIDAIIVDVAKYPSIHRTILTLHNQRGGETNVCTGWHAIEYMLWGVDRSPTGPGDRPASDFLDAASPLAARRREYLLEVTDLLVEHLRSLRDAWAPNAENHRQRFERDPQAALKSIIAGPALLTGFEMSGERLAVAYETRDQEEEHSCFSDNTTNDFKANVRGVANVLRGKGGAGLIAVIRERDAERSVALEKALDAAVRAVEAMPAPFDAAIRAADESPERTALKRALESLEALGEELGRCGTSLGWSLPSEPQG